MMRMQEEVTKIHVRESLFDYIVTLSDATRNHPDLERGASPRATLALTAMAKAYAYMNNRQIVMPEDVQAVFVSVMSHRLLLTPDAEFNDINTVDIAKEIVNKTIIPRTNR